MVLLAPPDDPLDLLACRLLSDPERLQRLGCYPAALTDEGEQDQSDPRDALGTLTPPSGDPSSADFKTSGTWYELFFQVS